METSPLNLIDRTNRWLQESVMIKLISIGIMVLLLLIPTSMITGLIEERQSRANEVTEEVGEKWSGQQTFIGPILAIPVEKEEKTDFGKDGIVVRKYTETAYFLPEDLSLEGTVNPQVLHRGLFDAVVYESAISMTSTFSPPDFAKLQVADHQVKWKEARLLLGMTDLRGITDQPVIRMGDQSLVTEPTGALKIWSKNPNSSESSYPVEKNEATRADGGMMANLNWNTAEDFKGAISIQLSMKGSKKLYVVPVGKTTKVKLSGPWPDPSFEGEFLPVSRTVAADHFEASWKVLHFNRPFSQEWIGTNNAFAGSDFGVRLLIPVDQYQKSIRSAKYAILLILLTFVSLLMVEIVKKIRIHPFQYILIGVAIIIYYSLLLSLSEHLGFNWSYGISTLATVTLITFYATTFLVERKMVVMLSALLSFFYLFIFVIIQLQDYSLLLGSIGLFFIIGALMYFSRNIKWYRTEHG